MVNQCESCYQLAVGGISEAYPEFRSATSQVPNPASSDICLDGIDC